MFSFSVNLIRTRVVEKRESFLFSSKKKLVLSSRNSGAGFLERVESKRMVVIDGCGLRWLMMISREEFFNCEWYERLCDAFFSHRNWRSQYLRFNRPSEGKKLNTGSKFHKRHRSSLLSVVEQINLLAKRFLMSEFLQQQTFESWARILKMSFSNVAQYKIWPYLGLDEGL